MLTKTQLKQLDKDATTTQQELQITTALLLYEIKDLLKKEVKPSEQTTNTRQSRSKTKRPD